MLLKIPFCLKRSHASGAGRGNCLPVPSILDVAAREDPGEDLPFVRDEDMINRLDIPVFIQIDKAGEGASIWFVADAEEHAGDRKN